MKYWKEKEKNPLEEMEFWTGTHITKLAENEIFLYGSNPQGINGAGAAKAAMSLSRGAKNGIGRGFNGSNAYALVTKSLNAGFLEKSTGILYDKEGYRSVSPEQIRKNIDELYEIARSPEHKDKKFLVSYQYESWPNGTPKKSLNGYTSQEMLEMFVKGKDIPPNIVFHESYKPHLEKILGVKFAQEQDDSPIAFTRVVLPYGWMGNMAPYPVEHDGVLYKTTEALFQSLRFSNHPEIQEIIRNEHSPMGAKMATKPHRHLLEAEGFEMMGAQDVENMRLCIDLKLEQHPYLAKQLVGTGSRVIIEDCSSRPRDSGLFWGAAKQNGKWVGKNVLGEILMDKRMELQNKMNNANNQEQNNHPGYTYFFSLTSPFSNFHPASFIFRDIQFSSTEQFMMYSKAKLFGNHDIAKEILAINERPLVKDFLSGVLTREEIVNDKELTKYWNEIQKDVKAFGRKVKNYDDAIWSEKRFNIVSVGVREKFSQNKKLKDILMATGKTYMIESSPYDKVWGSGLSEYDCKRIPEEKWPGQNLLGKVFDNLKIYFENEPPIKKMKI